MKAIDKIAVFDEMKYTLVDKESSPLRKYLSKESTVECLNEIMNEKDNSKLIFNELNQSNELKIDRTYNIHLKYFLKIVFKDNPDELFNEEVKKEIFNVFMNRHSYSDIKEFNSKFICDKSILYNTNNIIIENYSYTIKLFDMYFRYKYYNQYIEMIKTLNIYRSMKEDLKEFEKKLYPFTI